jgi:PPOX class probable F420-dependent enzyme
MSSLNDAQKAFLRAGHLAVVTTVRVDGSPHSTVVWIDCDGEDVVFNTARGRAKERHLLVDDRVSVVTTDGDDFHRWLTVDGRATLIDEGADAHIQSLADRYQGGVAVSPSGFGAGRVIVRVRPERIEHEGLGDPIKKEI